LTQELEQTYIDTLFDAAENGDLSKLTQLLEENPSLIDARRESGWTLLQEAIFGGNYDAIKLLLTRGADVHTQDERGWTPLHEAAYNSTAEVVKLLLSFGANTDATDNYGRTPLQYAVQDGFSDIVEVLREAQ
jgi:ankyrin repeat protein